MIREGPLRQGPLSCRRKHDMYSYNSLLFTCKLQQVILNDKRKLLLVMFLSGVDSVNAIKIGEGNQHLLDENGPGKYKATINTDTQQSELVIFAEVDDEEDVKQLLRYQVTTVFIDSTEPEG